MNRQAGPDLLDTLTLEKMAVIDLEEVMAIERTVFSSPWTAEMFYSEFFDNPLSFSFVARIGEAKPVVGYLFCWEVLDELHLMNVAVAPQWQRKGIGEAMVKRLLEIGREKSAERVLLEVRVSNLPARSLYQKLGFYEAGMRKNYYRSPTENALLLQYNFDERCLE